MYSLLTALRFADPGLVVALGAASRGWIYPSPQGWYLDDHAATAV
jgi:hypothetical protein